MGIYIRGEKLKKKRTYKVTSRAYFHGFEYGTDSSNIKYFSYHYIKQGSDTITIKIVKNSIRFASSLTSNNFLEKDIDVSKLSIEYGKIYLTSTSPDLSEYADVSFSLDDKYLYIIFKLKDVSAVGKFNGFSGFIKYENNYMVVYRKGVYDTNGELVSYYPAENPITWSGENLVTEGSNSRGNTEQPLVKNTSYYTNVSSYYTSGDSFSLSLSERDLGGEYFLVWAFGVSGIGAGVSMDNTPIGNLSAFKYQREETDSISRTIQEVVVYG